MVLTMRGIGDCTFEVAVQVLEMQKLQMMQSPMASGVGLRFDMSADAVAFFGNDLSVHDYGIGQMSRESVTLFVDLRADRVGKSYCQGRTTGYRFPWFALGVPALGLMELEPPRARDATRRRVAAFPVPGWYWAVWRISWFDSTRFARNVASDRYWRSPTHLAHFPCCNSMGLGRAHR